MTARTLVLLRHAKAERPGGVADINRPLTARGHADAAVAGAWLAAHGHRPDLVLCSPSKRTRQTWHDVAVAMPTTPGTPPPTVRYEGRLYEGDVPDLLEVLRDLADPVTTVLLIGHNPSVSDLVFTLDPDARLDSDGLRTCGLSVHVLRGSWRECGPRAARLATSYTARG